MPVQAKTTVAPVMVTNNDLHIVEEPFEVQNNIIETQTYSTELTTQSKTTSPMRVTNTSPMRVTNTTSPMVIDTTSPMRVTNTTSPMRVIDTDLLIVEPAVEAQSVIKTKSTIDMPDEAKNEN